MWKIIVVVYLIGVVFFGSIDYREDCVRNFGKNILVGISWPVTIPIVLILVGLGKAERVECR